MRKKVAVVGPVYPFRGAISLCTMRLAEELAKVHEVDLISFSRQYPKRFYPGGDDIDETVRDLAPPHASYRLDVLNPISWVREGLSLRRGGYDTVVIAWWIWVWALPYLVTLFFIPRTTRIVVQCHNIGDKEPSFWKRWLANAIFRRADLLVVHSAQSVEEVRERFGETRVAKTMKLFLPVLAIGREIPSRDDARRQLELEGKSVVLFFGQVRPFKGLDIAIRAWKFVKTDATLLVAGEVWFGEEGTYRKLAVQEGVADRIRFDLRFVPDAEVAAYFAAADVVVAPYRYENQSGVAMNAFHFRRPVIATDVGGLPDIIEEKRNGMLVPPENPEALAAAIDTFFSSSDREPMEEGAGESAAKYSWERYGSPVAEWIGARGWRLETKRLEARD